MGRTGWRVREQVWGPGSQGQGVSRSNRSAQASMNPREAPGKGLEDTPTCDSDETLEISFRDNIGIRVARNFQGPASGVWEDEGSQWSVLLSMPSAPSHPQDPAVCEWRSLTQGVEIIDYLLPVKGPFSLWRGNEAVRDHTGHSPPLQCTLLRTCSWNFRDTEGPGLWKVQMDQSIGCGGWPQHSCRERARAGGEPGRWGPRFRGVPLTSTCRILDIASPTGKSKDPRATTLRDTAAAAMGTTEKPTGRAEPAGTCTCWASPPPPARHSPSTGDTRTLTWGQEDGEGQSPSPVRLPTLHLPSPPPPPCAQPPRASRSDLYPGSCRGQAAARAAQSGGQRPAGGGACGIHGTLGVGPGWPHTSLTQSGHI